MDFAFAATGSEPGGLIAIIPCLILWFFIIGIPALIVKNMAERKGKKPWEWFFIGIIPVYGWVAAIWLSSLPDKKLVDDIASLMEKIQKYEFDQILSSQKTQPNKEPNNPKQIEKNPKRKKIDPLFILELKYSLAENLKEHFGHFTYEGQSQIIFNKIKVLCKFSSFSEDCSQWFWGVSKKYWQDWQDYDYLALILQNENQKNYSFLLLNSNEAWILFKKCSQSGEEKKINMRIYSGDNNTLHFSEWKDFDVEGRLKPLILKAAFNDGEKTFFSRNRA